MKSVRVASLKMSEAAPEEAKVIAAPVVPAWNAKSEAGVTAPFGFFDPLGICPTEEKDFKKYRESELKHGRIGMLAVLGMLVGEKAGFLFGGSITGPAIYQYQQAEGLFNAWSYNVVGFILAVEGYNIVKGWEPISETMESSVGVAGLREDYSNGNLNFDPLNLKPKSPAALKEMQTKELNNGRLAMLGAAGIVANELITNANTF